jgi:hypothetical protein
MNHSLLDGNVDDPSLLSDLTEELTLTSDGGLTFSSGVEGKLTSCSGPLV